MKSLYFIGDEELWSDAWFKALVESLEKKMNLTLLVYDSVKDLQKIKNISNKITVADRIILKKNISLNLSLEKKHQSLVFNLSKDREEIKKDSFVEWGISAELFLEKIGISESSQIIEEDFLSEVNIASEVSKIIESEEKSTLDSDAFSSDLEGLSKLLEVDFSAESKEILSQKPESQTEDQLEALSFDGSNQENIVDLEKPIDEVSKPSSDLESSNYISFDLEKNAEISLSEEKPFLEKESTDLDPQDLIAALENSPLADSSPVAESNPLAEGKEELDVLESLESSPAKIEVDAEPFSESPKPEVEVGKLLSSMSAEVSGEDLDVIKRYSNIKERELRESQASAEALRRQIRYFDERLKKSEEERRKLILKLEEVQSELRTTSDKKDENRAKLKNIENHYEDKIKELQIQLESSQFQSGKLEKKLEDFRDRVRNDLQKIRSRERELASRLEIQKRDAEALLSAKDERLLNQKRDIDRLEFEIDKLRERLLDNVNSSEERRKRITRSLQSLKLAQSVLSGLDEEPSEKDEKSKAA
jgi:hypothetical protein